jgi:predicted dienelactone hydrolase
LLIAASSAAAVARSATWETDFRADLRKIDVPVLVAQGDADQAVPFENTGKRVPAYVSDVQLVTVSGGPHATPWTYAEQVNTALLRFIGAHAAARPLTGAPATTQDSRAMPPSTSTMSLPDAGTVRWRSK